MGKYIIQYVLPAVLLVGAAWWLWTYVYLNHFSARIKKYVQVKKASKKYDKEINKP